MQYKHYSEFTFPEFCFRILLALGILCLFVVLGTVCLVIIGVEKIMFWNDKEYREEQKKWRIR